MVIYFKQPLCSQCNKPIEGLSWRLTAMNLKVYPKDKYFVSNSWAYSSIRDRYIHSECFDEYFGKEEE